MLICQQILCKLADDKVALLSTMATMGNRIKYLRNASGLTLQQLAERADTSRDTIWRLENGDRGLTDDWMRRLGEALGCKASDFLLEEDFSARLDQADMQLLADVKALSRPNKARLARLVTLMASALDDAERGGPANSDRSAAAG